MRPSDQPPSGQCFADRLLAWWEHHGRRDLPWQQPRDPYRVWVSEIMLQQTRVEVVRDYFERFVRRFPDLASLAGASLDEVLALWSGLGYYARARNLHRTAKWLCEDGDGRLPASEEQLASLPGIGRSTAAAIIAQAFDRRAVILDGNVKRVVARHAGIAGWPGAPAVERELWQAAGVRTPPDRAAAYTQAIMDLGASICVRRRPRCPDCPVGGDCVAHNAGRQDELPTPKPTRALPERAQRFLIARDAAGRVLLERRPPAGIWGGLWCLPELDDAPLEGQPLPAPRPLRHVFSHFALTMSFAHVRLDPPGDAVEDDARRWFASKQALASGLPQPIRKVLIQLA